MKRRTGIAALALAGWGSWRPAAAQGEDKLRQIMERVRPSAGTGQLAASTPGQEQALLRERAQRLLDGEAALARLDTAAAEAAFDRAAGILHTADTEMGLVRTYMQAGNYRRALAFGSHTAGAHLDVVGGTALYAWLLHLGGQSSVAARLLGDAVARAPQQPMAAAVLQQLQSGRPHASGTLLEPPVRLAPYSGGGPAASARAGASAVLLADGRHALAPAAGVPAGGVWLRNGMGQVSHARTVRRLAEPAVVLLQLDTGLPVPEGFACAMADPFPGSVNIAVEYVAGVGSQPAWPVLRTGFTGGATGRAPGERWLGTDMPAGPRGGPVFDGSGRLAGLALPAAAGKPDRLVAVSQWQAAVGMPLAPAAPPGLPARASVDAVYEAALRTSLQVLATQG